MREIELIAEVARRLEEAARSDHRVLIYLANECVQRGIFKSILDHFAAIRCNPRVLLAYRERDDPMTRMMIGEMRDISFSEVNYDDVEKFLGTTWDAVIMDVNRQMRPNDLGILVEVVRGGGIVMMVGPSASEIDSWITDFHLKCVTPPFNVKDLVKRFERRMFSKTIGRTGVIYVDPDGEVAFGDMPPPQPRLITEPFGAIFPREIYELCVTNDQILALKAVEKLLPKRRWALILKANRGRGKSAALGLIAACLILSRRKRRFKDMLVTSPEPENSQTIFEFACRGLDRVGVEYDLRERQGLPVELACKFARMFYRRPLPALNAKAGIALIDEAAGIPVPILLGFKKRFWRAVYSSTIHGYEGAGRGFMVRLLTRLRSEFRQDFMELEMREPIRYGDGDPVESWLYDVLLLDSEPAILDREELNLKPEDCEYAELDKDKLFAEDEHILRQLIGLYVLTHYRNRPNDVAMLANHSF